ncbi:hypothetical protein BD779DRAFT_1493299 [Infundibulicybe gibba]|nr:hypothetical protein BD779DRAFT_1493299 [Infundibulicybe gibba]
MSFRVSGVTCGSSPNLKCGSQLHTPAPQPPPSTTIATMARDPPILSSVTPTAIVPARVHIGHVQLRDLIICPQQRGVVNYIQGSSIVERNLNVPRSTPRTLANLSFIPNSITSLAIPGTNDTLLAAGGQQAEIHLSLHSPASTRHRHSRLQWQFEMSLDGSINNSVLLTSLSLTRSNESSVDPRIGISNNDRTVKFYDVPLRVQNPKRTLCDIGTLRLDSPVNHSSISPDGRTLLSVGDSSKVYLHHITGGARISFSPITTLLLPPPDVSPFTYASASLAASFSTSFSSDGSKFAIASQEGVVAVWDVRSSKPLKVFQTDKSRHIDTSNGGATGWLSDDPYEWTRGNSKAPGWSVRSIKFGGGDGGGRPGKETLAFTEHTSLLHIVDARTFDMEEIVRVPTVRTRPSSPPLPQYQTHQRERSSPPIYRYINRTFTSPPTPGRSPHSYNGSGFRSPERAGFQPPPPPGQPHIMQALEDTFRISSGYLPSPTLTNSSQNTLAGHDLDGSGLLVLPLLGDREVDSNIRTLLGRDRSPLEEEDLNTGSTHGDYEYQLNRGFIRRSPDEEMEVDELESDCVTSRTPSRSSSPSPSTHAPGHASPASRLISPLSSGSSWDQEHTRARKIVESVAFEDDLDLAGTCFDPSGHHVYVASTESVAEWSIQGAEKRWWNQSEWA